MKDLKILREQYQLISRREVALGTRRHDQEEMMKQLSLLDKEILSEEAAISGMWSKLRCDLNQTGAAVLAALDIDRDGCVDVIEVISSIFGGADKELVVRISELMVTNFKGSVDVYAITESLEDLISN